jgi:uncharacterized membrane protein YdjX (TVP38/TMEM64 family)
VADVGRFKPYIKLLILVLILGSAALIVRVTPVGEYVSREGIASAIGTVRGAAWAPVVFVIVYATATALALPGSALTITGGALFGFGFGALLNSIGANIGANAAFLLAKALGREGVERLGGKRIEGLNRATVKHGLFGLLILRLVPLVPFNALNFGSGLTGLKWRDYAIATVVGILPGTLVYTFFADALIQGSTQASQDARTRLWIAAGLFLMLSLVPLVARKLGFRLSAQSSSEVSP